MYHSFLNVLLTIEKKTAMTTLFSVFFHYFHNFVFLVQEIMFVKRWIPDPGVLC